MSKIILAACLLFCNHINAQGTAYYSYDANTGTSQKIGYSIPVKPPEYFSKYIPKVDADLYTQIGMYKQQQYNENLNSVKQKIITLYGMIDESSKYNPEPIGKIKSNLDNFCVYLSSNRIDYSDDVVYNQVSSSIREMTLKLIKALE